jgi:hypothetical protein
MMNVQYSNSDPKTLLTARSFDDSNILLEVCDICRRRFLRISISTTCEIRLFGDNKNYTHPGKERNSSGEDILLRGHDGDRNEESGVSRLYLIVGAILLDTIVWLSKNVLGIIIGDQLAELTFHGFEFFPLGSPDSGFETPNNLTGDLARKAVGATFTHPEFWPALDVVLDHENCIDGLPGVDGGRGRKPDGSCERYSGEEGGDEGKSERYHF